MGMDGILMLYELKISKNIIFHSIIFFEVEKINLTPDIMSFLRSN